MQARGQFDGMLRHVYVHWPTYLFGFGGGALFAMGLFLLGMSQGWWGLVPLSLALLLILAYFCAASLWAAYEQFDRREHLDHHVLARLGPIQPTDRLAHVSLGSRITARGLAQRLTGGKVIVIDVFNPQLAPGAGITRARRLVSHPPDSDPRLNWSTGSIDLLPLPDAAVRLVTMSRTLGEFVQPGDRLCLLREVRRILAPGGRLLLAEPARTQTAWLVRGPMALRLEPPERWRNLLQEAGFVIQVEETTLGLVYYWRAVVDAPDAPRQLAFDFGF